MELLGILDAVTIEDRVADHNHVFARRINPIESLADLFLRVLHPPEI